MRQLATKRGAMWLVCLLLLGACESSSGGDADSSGGAADVPVVTDGTAPDSAALEVAPSGDAADAVASEDARDALAAEDVPPPEPFAPPAVCGADPHEWLPAEEVGQPLAFGPLDLFHSITGSQLDALLAQVGYERVTPVPYGVKIYYLRYTTQDHGELREATAAVGIPQGMDSTGPLPVALWLHHSVGFVDACAPLADPLFAPVAPAVMASQGYLAVAPDYLGLMGWGEPSPPSTFHSYLIAEPTAIASLDAVRAALLAVENEAIAVGDPERLVLIGGSQGGHAAFAVDRYAPYYAPELGILAAATAVPPIDLLSIARRAATDWGPAARTLPAVLIAMAKWYDGPADLTGVLTDDEPEHLAATAEERYRAKCGFTLPADGIDTLEKLYSPAFLAAARAGDWEVLRPWSCYLAENSFPLSSVPYVSDTPFLAAFAENDELVFTDEQRADMMKLCDQGYRIRHVECAGLGHTPGGRATAPLMLDWLARRVAGEPLDDGDICVLTEPVDCEMLP